MVAQARLGLNHPQAHPAAAPTIRPSVVYLSDSEEMRRLRDEASRPQTIRYLLVYL